MNLLFSKCFILDYLYLLLGHPAPKSPQLTYPPQLVSIRHYISLIWSHRLRNSFAKLVSIRHYSGQWFAALAAVACPDPSIIGHCLRLFCPITNPNPNPLSHESLNTIINNPFRGKMYCSKFDLLMPARKTKGLV